MRRFLDLEVLHILPSEHNVVVHIVRGRDFLRCIVAAAFGAVGDNVLQRDCRGFRVDFVEGTDIAGRVLAIPASIMSIKGKLYTEYRCWISERCASCRRPVSYSIYRLSCA